jgi:tripartite-type tricarboxylate transporter receptor subunit TctC
MVLQLPARRNASAIFASFAALAAWFAPPAMAQTFPSSPVHIFVGFGAGSTADILARLIGHHMEIRLGQPVVVENRSGNSSMLAAEAVARAPKDGYTLFMATVANTLNPAQNRSSFNLAKNMEPIALLGVSPNVLVVHPSIPAKTVKELIAIAKAKPESLTFGTSGSGTASQLAAELFNIRAGTKIVTVSYQGGANQGLSDLLTGRITVMFNVAVTLAPYANSGQLVPLAVGQAKRTAIMPNVPTMDEEGIPGFDVGIWIGLLGPAGIPAPVIEKLADSANEALQTEMVKSALTTQGIDPIGAPPQAFREFINADIEKWQSIIAAAEERKQP